MLLLSLKEPVEKLTEQQISDLKLHCRFGKSGRFGHVESSHKKD